MPEMNCRKCLAGHSRLEFQVFTQFEFAKKTSKTVSKGREGCHESVTNPGSRLNSPSSLFIQNLPSEFPHDTTGPAHFLLSLCANQIMPSVFAAILVKRGLVGQPSLGGSSAMKFAPCETIVDFESIQSHSSIEAN